MAPSVSRPPPPHRHRRSAVSLSWLLALFLAGACSGDVAPEDDEAPAAVAPAETLDLAGRNLLLITIDTLRADRLGAYGDTEAATPNLDALARGGVRFDNSYSPVPLTLPAHSTLFTGRYPFTHGVRTNGRYFLPLEETTLAELLAGRGYRTWAAVATYILSAKFGLGQGFEGYDDGLGAGELIRGFSSEIPAAEVAARFRRWLASGVETPFFAWLHFYDPHQPYRPPAPWAERFAEDPYRGEVAYVDSQVGAVLDELSSRGLTEETLVVVTSDHGEGFGEHGEVGHGILAYEEDLRVPLIFAAPGVAPRVARERVRLVDLLPTLLELLSVESPAGVEGESFARLLAGGEEASPRDVYFESMLGRDENGWAPLTGLIAGGHKYLSLPERELYDLEQDPGETENLFPGERAVVRELDRALRELLLSSQLGGAGAGRRGDARRDPSREDLAQLEALGYLSAGSQTAEVIDPKRGIRLERQLQQAREDVAAGRLAAAEAALERLAADNDEVGVGSYYFLRHQVAAAKDDQAAAVSALEAGMARFPDSEQFPFLLAHYQLRLGQAAEAERLARTVIEKSPRFSQAVILHGRALEHLGRLEEAIARYREARAQEPRNAELGIRLAETLARAGDGPAAIEVYHRLADAGTLDDRAGELVKLAMLSARAGKPERAEELFRRVLELEPSGMHHLSFAFVLAQQRKMQQAIAQMETALGDYGDQLSPEQTQMARTALEQWRVQ